MRSFTNFLSACSPLPALACEFPLSSPSHAWFQPGRHEFAAFRYRRMPPSTFQSMRNSTNFLSACPPLPALACEFPLSSPSHAWFQPGRHEFAAFRYRRMPPSTFQSMRSSTNFLSTCSPPATLACEFPLPLPRTLGASRGGMNLWLFAIGACLHPPFKACGASQASFPHARLTLHWHAFLHFPLPRMLPAFPTQKDRLAAVLKSFSYESNEILHISE